METLLHPGRITSGGYFIWNGANHSGKSKG